MVGATLTGAAEQAATGPAPSTREILALVASELTDMGEPSA
jgi:hypothetical protein